ncbi:hypothetical protein GCM10023187_15510 [Nibrella viscosa]|uniref:ATP synthase subunit delta n=1 Tax=Nibrella viscosa TaxID=1084524 RepID=A0ABP8K6F3_9BACT
MAAESSVAFRYAKSLIDLAKEKGLTEEIYADMEFFRRTLAQNRQLLLMFKNPIVRKEKKYAVLKAIFANRVNPMTMAIFEIITRKHREGIIDAIADEFVRLYNELKGIQRAQVITTVPLTDELRRQFTNIVAKSTGMTVQLEEKVDPRLIGGYILQIGDKQIDASIRHQLNEIRLEFMH